MCFLAFFRAKYFLFQNSRVLRQLIGDFEKWFVKKFRKVFVLGIDVFSKDFWDLYCKHYKVFLRILGFRGLVLGL